MPTTVNGIGTGYWGRRNVLNVNKHCDKCCKVTPHTSYDTFYCFVVIYLPVIPLARKRIIERCSVCDIHQSMPLKKYEELKQESIREATANYRANPSDLLAIRTYIATLISFGAEQLFNQAAAELERLYSYHAEIQGQLGDGYRIFKNMAACERCYKAALQLEDSGNRRFKLAYMLIEQKRSTEALPIVMPLFQENYEGQKHLFYTLFFGFQAEGLHEQALYFLERLLAAFPELAEEKALIKGRAKSLKHRGSGKKIVTKAWLSNAQEDQRSTLIRYASIGLVLLFIILLYANMLAGKHTIHILNGTNTDYEVQLGAHRIKLEAKSYQTMTLPEGDTQVSYTNRNGQTIEEVITLKTLFLTRIFNRDAFVLNPDRTALVLQETAYYVTSTATPKEGTHLLESPAFFRKYNDISYAFKKFPEEVTIIGPGISTSKNRISVLPTESTEQAMDYLLAMGFQEVALDYLTNTLQFDASDKMAVLFYAHLASPDKAKLMLEPKLETRPIDLNYHFIYQDLFSYSEEALRDRYRTLLAADPQNADLLFLNGRLDVSDDSQVDLQQAANATHQYALNELVFRKLCNGKLAEGMALNSQLLLKDPQENHLLLHLRFLEAAQDYEKAIELAREFLRQNPQDQGIASRIYLWQMLMGQKLLESDIKALIPKGLDPEVEREWRLYFQSLAQYINGDLKSIVSPSMVELFQNPIKLSGQVTDAALDYKGDLDYLIGLIIKARLQGKNALADKALNLLIQEYQNMPTYHPLLAEILSGKQPERILTLAVDPETKRGLLVVVGQQYPEWRTPCFLLAQKLNYSRNFPFFIVKEALEASNQLQ